ncbi:MAG TPA: RNA polymerase sigma factor [Bryobacteraceae bacterium]|jgi:RNA polymerase sigma-70 factor (ECF subfamily)
MSITTAESAIAFAREIAPAERTSHRPPPLELEVVDLFDRLRVRLLRYVLGFGLPVQDAEEIVQEVFLSLFQHLQQGKSRENLTGWIFRVAHNLALKRRTFLSSALNPDGGGLAQEADVYVDPAPNPEDQLASHQTQRRLLAVFGALPEQDRRCLALRAEGLRYREIGQILGISLGAVSLSLSRSLRRLTHAAER